jgi:hypothetical protein
MCEGKHIAFLTVEFYLVSSENILPGGHKPICSVIDARVESLQAAMNSEVKLVRAPRELQDRK